MRRVFFVLALAAASALASATGLSALRGTALKSQATGEAQWLSAGNMSVGRWGHTATLLANGKVLVVGGMDLAGNNMRTAELYDPAQNIWMPAASPRYARAAHTATRLNDGRVLVVGGLGESPRPYTSTAEIYDPATNSWSDTGSLSITRLGNTATLLEDGRVLVAGGDTDSEGSSGSTTSKTAEVYDPATGVWTPTEPMAERRSQHTATLLLDHRVVVAGGLSFFQGQSQGNGPTTSEIFDPTTNEWTAAGSLSHDRQASTATLLDDGQVLLAGGTSDWLKTSEIYDPASGVWAESGPVNENRGGAGAALLSNGGVLITGGAAVSRASYGYYANTTEIFKSDSATWTYSATMASARYGQSTTLLNDGSVLVAGGVDTPWQPVPYEPLSSAERYFLALPPIATATPTVTATAVPPPPTPVPPVVVLVHGIDPKHTGDNECGMEGIRDFLKTPVNTGDVQFRTDCQIYKTRLGVEAGAKELKRKIDGWKRAGVPKVDIVAHSMGGLVARYYIEKLDGRGSVRSLTMLGTPNLGSNYATALCALWAGVARLDVFRLLDHPYDQGACDMVPIVSPLLIKLNLFPGSHAGVTYNVLTGWKGRGPLEGGVWNDCVVSVLSATGLAFHTELFPTTLLGSPVLHVDASGPAKINGCGPSGKAEPNDPEVRARVAAILLESNGIASSVSAAASGNAGPAVADSATSTPTPIPAEPPSSTIGSASGVLTQGQTVDTTITMPASQPTGTFIFRSPDDPSAALTFALLRPGGTPVATNDADVTYETGAGFGGLVETHYTIANPDAGTWTMRITGTTVPSPGWPYDVQAIVPGGISVTAGAGAGHYDIGQPFDLSADVAINDVPYTGATVIARVTKPDQSTADVALTGAGGGSYTGTFADTAACGLYSITVIADGADNGAPFSRQDRTIAIAGVPGNVILDPCNADSDDDGLTDKDEIDLYGTNPANADTDDDGYTDPREIALGENPADYCKIMRADQNRTLDPNVRGDGVINSLDLLAVAKLFGPFHPGAREDQNGDGNINSLDLLLVAQKFLQNVSACP